MNKKEIEKKMKTRTLFPVLNDIEKLREAIKTLNPELRYTFFEKEDSKGEHIYFSYKFFSSHTFPDPLNATSPERSEFYYLLRECRGLVFEKKTGNPISRSFHKFFNIDGPLEECSSKLIDLKEKHYFLEKKDGTMTNALYITNEKGEKIIKFRTKMGYETDVAKKIQNFIDSNDLKENYLKFISKWLDEGYTPIFEFVAPNNKIVVEYKKGELILLALRNVKTGEYISYEDTIKAGNDFKLPFVSHFDFGDDIEKALKKIQSLEGIEGFVLRFDDGRMFKIKTQWYREIHDSNLSQLAPGKMKENEIWELILDNKIDDVIASLKTKEMKEKFDNFSDLLLHYFTQKVQKIEKLLKQYKLKTNDRKSFHSELMKDEEIHEITKKILLSSYDKEDVEKSFKKFIQREIGKKIPDDLRRYLEIGFDKKLELHDDSFSEFKK
eukprot:gene7394-11716_t